MFDTKQLRPRVDKGFVYELKHRAKPRGNSLRIFLETIIQFAFNGTAFVAGSFL